MPDPESVAATLGLSLRADVFSLLAMVDASSRFVGSPVFPVRGSRLEEQCSSIEALAGPGESESCIRTRACCAFPIFRVWCHGMTLSEGVDRLVPATIMGPSPLEREKLQLRI